MGAEILTWILAFLIPAGVMAACNRYRFLDSIGPIMILYALGLAVSLTGFHAESQSIISGLTIPLAIPLILMGNRITLSGESTRHTVTAFFSCLASAVIAVFIAYMLFRPDRNVAGMVAGCVTGGTMNMAAVKLALGVDDATFVIMNTYDMIVSFIYMVFLLTVGIRLARRIMPNKTACQSESVSTADSSTGQPSKGVCNYVILLAVAAGCAAISLGVARLFDESIFMMIFILVLSALGVALSFCRSISTKPESYGMGMYLVYVFSFVVASMADFRGMSIGQNANLLAFFATTIFCSLFLHLLFCYLLKVDADTAVIASNAFVNAPPSVPVIASAMKNRNALTAGLTIGIVGYAIGTYLGVMVAKAISLLP